MRLRLGLKAHGYLSLTRQNPWLLRCDEKVRNYVRYKLTPKRTRISPRTAGPVFLTLSITRRCNMPWYIVSVDVAGNLGLCSAHASCTGPNLFALDADETMNTEPWTSTRRGLLDPSPAVPPRCVGCYTLSDPWRRDM